MNHMIVIESDLAEETPFAPLIESAISGALEAQGATVGYGVDVLLTDNQGIHEINLAHRGVDAPTDVLSFPMFELGEGEFPDQLYAEPDTGLVHLGDMVLSVERAKAQAEEYNHSVEREVAYLTVHSVLHLLGYDHMDEGIQKETMRAREEAILRHLGMTRGEK